MRKMTVTLIFSAAAALAGCVSPTPYRAAGAEGQALGYTSAKLSDQLYRVRFDGTARTPARWADAFVLFRSAEVAREAGAPAFRIIEGTVDPAVLSGDDVFGRFDPEADVHVSVVARAREPAGDRVVTAPPLPLQRTAGAMPVFRAPAPVFRMPPPALPKARAPVYIYTPGYYGGPPPLQARSVLIELRADLRDRDDRTFDTEEVLQKLGPRIKRPAPASEAGRPAVSGASL